MSVKITKAETSKLAEVDFDNLVFGKKFSDHMFVMEYNNGKWQEPTIVPFADFSISPANMTIQYAQTIFEGMKAYRTQDGKVNIFRPERHAKRINYSARRMCIPEVDPDVFVEALHEFVNLDREWVPKKRGDALYLRPFIFGDDAALGLSVSKTYKFVIIGTPVSMYYKEGLNPISLMTSGEYARAGPGGVGDAKAGGNYGASLYATHEAMKKGYSQVLWLDGCAHKYVEEVGTMNIFFVFGNELVTPSLDGTILGGLTRECVIAIAKEWGYAVTERKLTIDEVMAGAEDGTLTEAFGTGTAVVIAPVGTIAHNDKTVTINDNKTGEFSQKIYDELCAIRYGEKEDRYGWNYII